MQQESFHPCAHSACAATATGSGREVKLFIFTIVWPSTWFNSGYSTFSLGLESLEDARAWHAAFEESIMALRTKRMGKKSAGDASSLAGDIAYQGASLEVRHLNVGPGTALIVY